jgi:TolB-like protein
MIHHEDTARSGDRAGLERPAACGTEWRPPAIAVLPFIDVSDDPRIDALSDGISQEIADAFTALNGFELNVRRCTLFPSCTNVHLGDLGWCLDVALLLLGNVRERRGVLVTTAQLICVRHGLNVWSGVHRCDRAARSTVAREIAAQIAHELN